MIAFGKTKGQKIHTRDIKLATYEFDDERIVIEGAFVEKRLYDYQLASGKKKPAGVIHHMIIRWLFNMSTFTIEDIEAEMLTVPYEECIETVKGMSLLRGMVIASGFTIKLKELIGGTKGCAHLLALLTAMAPAALQGYAAHHSQKPSGYGPERHKVVQILVNNCHPWRSNGALVKKYLK
jgi:hypothetical protein